ncbi:MAG: mechanosensitive ion channel family protein [Candidatus Paceibacterota bacterium]|jgi:small-conductance mechanosensitive channel
MLEQIIKNDFWNVVVFGNPMRDYLIMLATLAVLLIVLRFVQHFILKHLRSLAKKTETDLDDMLVSVIESLRPPFYFFLSVYLSSRTLVIVPTAEKVLSSILVLWVVYQIVVALEIVMEYAISKKLKENGGDDSDKTTGNIVRIVINFVIWSIGLILALSNLGINVTSLIAGLGIGGVAIALAAQNILGDLFSSFAIHFDKPFVVGDSITVGTDVGTVEKIGLKTTRLRGLQGEELIISNKELTTARIQNFKQMTERRVVFIIGVEHSTDNKKLRALPGMIKDIIDAEPTTRFDRSHFKKFSDSSLDIETVYFVNSREYPVFMDTQQNINFAIHERFAKEDINMAFPTRTIHTIKG